MKDAILFIFVIVSLALIPFVIAFGISKVSENSIFSQCESDCKSLGFENFLYRNNVCFCVDANGGATDIDSILESKHER